MSLWILYRGEDFCPRTVSPQQSIRAVYGIFMGFNEMISTRFWYMGWYGSVWEWVVEHHFMAILVEKIMFLGGLVKLGVPPKPMIIGFPSKRIRLFWWLPSSKLTVRPWQIGVGRLVSINNCFFSGSMLIYQRGNYLIWGFPEMGGTPIAGWFSSWKIIFFNSWFRGTPILGNLLLGI